ncbi:MAG: diaminopimelate decarboxylase [Rhodobiaceae bacterium]|jgi:diaminopimelate decarboxylase|nr:diaminopimelate decarboxylase [Rhodobiaceae bacterium]MDG2495964.1 diaminopimelate decarboxylase [Alphaproteobacteria bacterium]
MDHFLYRDGALHAEDIAIAEIAQAVGTPFYCYSTATLERHFSVLDQSLADAGLEDRLICYSVKANSNIAVIATLAKLGAGADIVSQGEMVRALKAGIEPSKIVFSGVGKTADEMHAALEAGILQFNVESLSEIDMLAEVAKGMGKRAQVALRVNPDIDAGTHEKISTGKAENKFGIAWEDAEAGFAHVQTLEGVEARGIDIHIGSQITDTEPFRLAFEKVAGLLARLREKGHVIDRLDLGGGLGVPYARDNEPPLDPTVYANLIADILGDKGCTIMLEPGRLIAANAGVLVTSVIRAKQGRAKNFMIVDAAMTELMRPTLYGAYHDIKPVKEMEADALVWDVVGPVCESGDFLGQDRSLPVPDEGDLLAVFAAGAYGAVLGSSYNTRPAAPEVLVSGHRFAVVRARPDYEAMLERESLPDWV